MKKSMMLMTAMILAESSIHAGGSQIRRTVKKSKDKKKKKERKVERQNRKKGRK